MKWDAEKMKSDAEKKELIAQKDAVMYILLLSKLNFSPIGMRISSWIKG